MTTRFALACAASVFVVATSATAQTVSLQFENGLVTLNAQNTPIRAILAEWSRIGGTRIVNGDRVGGAPVTIELNAVPERQALEILLRSVAGYVTTQRDAQATGASAFGGVMILATSSAPRTQAPVTFSNPTIQTRAFDDARDEQDADDRSPVVARPPVGSPFSSTPGAAGAAATPVVIRPGVAPNGQEAVPPAPTTAQPPRPATTLQTLPGTSRPGEITPPPQQQPPQPNQR